MIWPPKKTFQPLQGAVPQNAGILPFRQAGVLVGYSITCTIFSISMCRPLAEVVEDSIRSI